MKRARLTHVAAASLALAGAASTYGAERCVVYEHFTATWCTYCTYAGQALNMMLDNYPDTVVVLQAHVSDDYTTSWGNIRANKYGVSGIPHVVVDGVRDRVGASNTAQAYSTYLSDYNWRMGVATEIAPDIVVSHAGGNTYQVDASYTNEGAAPITLEVQIVETLDDYPSSSTKYCYCVMSGHNMGSITIAPGATETVSKQITIAAASQANIGNLRFMTFAQIPGAGNQEIHNGAFAQYPFVTTCEHSVVEVAVSQDAIADDPALEGAKCFDLMVTTTMGDDWTSSDGTITVDGDLFQSQFGTSVPQTALWTMFPSEEFDSFFSAPNFAQPGFAEGPDVTNNSMSAIWFDTPTSPEGAYTIGRFTVTSGTLLSLSGTTTAANTGGALLDFSFEIPLDFADCPGDLNGDGLRNQSDLGLLLAAYGQDNGGDIDGDGDTDQADLGALLAVYNVPCE